MNRFDRITINPAIVNGQACIRGMRLTVKRVVEAEPCIRIGMSCLESTPSSMRRMFARRWISRRAIWMTA